MGRAVVDLVGAMMAYENDSLTPTETVELFSELVKSGTVWTLQGFYGRAAAALVESGILTAGGDITPKAQELLEF